MRGHVISHSLPGDGSMVAITRYYVAPPVASGYFLQPFSKVPPSLTQLPQQGRLDKIDTEQSGTSGTSATTPAPVPIDPVSHPDDAFPHQSPFHPHHKGDKPRSPFDPRFKV